MSAKELKRLCNIKVTVIWTHEKSHWRKRKYEAIQMTVSLKKKIKTKTDVAVAWPLGGGGLILSSLGQWSLFVLVSSEWHQHGKF